MPFPVTHIFLKQNYLTFSGFLFQFKGIFLFLFSRKDGEETEVIPSELCVSKKKVSLHLQHMSGQKIMLKFKALN